MTTRIHVYDKDTRAPIEGATVTCTGHTPQLTDGNGNVSFELAPFTRYRLRADAEGYVISEQQSIIGADNYVEFGLEKEEPIEITVKRPTWVSMIIMPSEAEYPIGEEIEVSGYIRIGTKPYTEGEVWLMDSDAGETITEKFSMDDFGAGSYYELRWTPSEYKTGGYNITVGCDAFISGSNPLGAWSEMPNGSSKHLNVVGVGMANMGIYPHTMSRNLFESDEDTIIACDDWTKACTMFRFQIRNNSSVTTGAWYKVSIVGGGTLYEGTTSALGHWEYSERIEDYVCALPPDGLPVGTHTIKVEVGSEGYATPTDTLTDEIHVISADVLSVTTHYQDLELWQDGARVKGSVANTNGLATDVGFEYGETTSYGNKSWADQTTISCDFFKDLRGLEPHTLYHFRAIAENEVESANGKDMTFWTREELGGIYFNILLPNDTLLESEEIIACDDWGKACTHFNFQIKNGKGSTLDAWYTVSIAGGGTLYSKTITVSAYGTTPTISDYICAEGVGAGGLPVGEHEILVEVGLVGQGPDASESEWLTVVEHGTPIVDTTRVDDPTFTSATLVGTLKDVGIETRVGFEYGLLRGSMNTTWREGYIQAGEYKVAVSDLESNEIYRFRAVAKAGEEFGYGEERTFETVPAVIDTISLGWNLEDAKMDEYNAHFKISHLSESKRYRVVMYGARGYEYTRIEPVTNKKEVEIKYNIPLEVFEEYDYSISCGVYDLDTKKWLLTQYYPVPSFDLKLYTNIGGEITSIPTTIRTETSYPFIIQIDNEGEKDRDAAIIFVFDGVGLGPGYVYAYPHDEPSKEEDSILVPAGQSVAYEITVNVPNDAVPLGAMSATYNLNIILSAFE